MKGHAACCLPLLAAANRQYNEFQPVLVTCAWTGKIPAAVTIALGTNVQSSIEFAGEAEQ